MTVKIRESGNEINMGDMVQNKYIKKNITKDWLLSNGFHYNRLLSNSDTDIFTYRFPVCRFEKFIILECELKVILGEDNVHINVYDYNTINKYAPFYYMEYGNYTVMLKEIWQKIDKELKRLGIKRENDIKNGSKNKGNKERRNNSNI